MERRRAPRVELLAELSGRLIVLDETVRVHEISVSGLAIETRFPLSPRTRHDLHLELEHETIAVRARVIHSRMLMDGDRISFVSGLALDDLTESQRDAIARFVEAAGTSFADPCSA